MAFYDWLEGVSNAIDEKIYSLIYGYQQYGFLYLACYLIPGERFEGLASIMRSIQWCDWEINYLDDVEYERNKYELREEWIDKMAEKYKRLKYINFYNEIKYWWMPSK